MADIKTRDAVKGTIKTIDKAAIATERMKSAYRLTLHIAFMKVQGYSTREIASYLRITEKAVYRRLDRLKEKIQKIFE